MSHSAEGDVNKKLDANKLENNKVANLFSMHIGMDVGNACCSIHV